jgi:hypothetical protein
MKIQPPQYLMAGIILLVLGLQFLLVDSYVLSMQASEIVESQLDIPAPPRVVKPIYSLAPPMVLMDPTCHR